MLTLKTGDAARYETVRDGLVPCKVVSIDPTGCWSDRITLKVTRGHAGYRPGEIIRTSFLHAIPAKAVVRRRYSTVILPFEVISADTTPGKA